MVTQHFRCNDPMLQEYFISYYLIEGRNNDCSNFRIFPSNNSVLSLGWQTSLEKKGSGFILRSSPNACYSIYFDSITTQVSFEYQGPIYELSILIRPQYTTFLANRLAQLGARTGAWQRMISNLQAEVFCATDLSQRQRIIERWLREVLLAGGEELGRTVVFIATTTKLLEQGLSIQAIAPLLGTSRKTLHKTFREYTLSTPGAYQKIHRFRNAMRLRQEEQEESLTSLAYASGYYDQSHMVRDFRRLSGLSPRRLLKELRYVGEGDVFWLPE